MKRFITLISLLPFLICATYHVNRGGEGNYTTIAQINNASFSAGDIIIFDDDNIWNETLIVGWSGLNDNHITFKRSGTGTNKPLIQGDGAQSYSAYINSKQYLTFDGLHFKNSRDNDTSYAVYVTGDSSNKLNIWFENCSFTNEIDKNTHTLYIKNVNNFKVLNCDISGGNYGIRLDKGTPSWDSIPSMYGVINNCTIHDQDDGLADEWDGIKLNGNDFTGLIISNNEFYGWNEDAIDSLGGGGNITVEGNKFHDPGTDLIDYCTCLKFPKDSLTGIRISDSKFIFRNNVCYNLRNNTTNGWGVYIQDTGDVQHNFTHEIYNNIFYNCDRPMNIGSFGPLEIYHNTCIGKSRGIAIQNNTVADIKNNILKSDPDGIDFVINGNNCDITGGYNTLFHNSSVVGTGYTGNSTDKYSTDPLLSSRYRLLSGSPAINAGATGLNVTDDYLGNPRDAQPDIGSYEAGNFIKSGTLHNATLN